MATASQPSDNKLARPRAAEQLPAIRPPRLPYHPEIEKRFGIDKASWKALVEAIFPTATSTESIILALSYCRARKLDPFKRVVHIVPIYNKDQRCYVDTIWPGIGELRTTAFRTGEYAGRGETRFGDDVTQEWPEFDKNGKQTGTVEVTYPEWAQVTVRRMVKGVIVDFAGPRVYWVETYATRSHNDDAPNSMWQTRPRGQIDKCAEAAALRSAFPEECGSDYIPEEVQHSAAATIDVQPTTRTNTLDDLTDRLTQSAPPVAELSDTSYEPPAKTEPDQPDTGLSWQKYEFGLASAATISEAQTVYDHWFGLKSDIPWTDEQHAEAAQLKDLRQASIREGRGTRSNRKE